MRPLLMAAASSLYHPLFREVRTMKKKGVRQPGDLRLPLHQMTQSPQKIYVPLLGTLHFEFHFLDHS